MPQTDPLLIFHQLTAVLINAAFEPFSIVRWNKNRDQLIAALTDLTPSLVQTDLKTKVFKCPSPRFRVQTVAANQRPIDIGQKGYLHSFSSPNHGVGHSVLHFAFATSVTALACNSGGTFCCLALWTAKFISRRAATNRIRAFLCISHIGLLSYLAV
jgi:hypothetical protein